MAEGDAVYLQLSFDAKTMFGYNGVDGRGRKVVRNKVLDYTGEYTLACTNGDVKLGETSVWVRPYDSFYTQSQVDKKMDELAARANAAGIYGKVEQIGTSSAGYPTVSYTHLDVYKRQVYAFITNVYAYDFLVLQDCWKR